MLKQSVVTVVAVNSHNNIQDNNNNNNNHVSTKKVPSLFKRLFSRDSTKNEDNFDINPYKTQTTKYVYKNTTKNITNNNTIANNKFKNNNTNTKTNNNTINIPNCSINNNAVINDLCNKCQINTPQLSVTKSNAMKAEKLCSKCHVLTQQPVRNNIQKVEKVEEKMSYEGDGDVVNSGDGEEVVKFGSEGVVSKKTVIVMQANNVVLEKELTCQNANPKGVQTNKVEVVAPNQCSFEILPEKEAIVSEPIKKEKTKIFKLSFQPSFRKGDLKPNFEGRIVSNDVSPDTFIPPISEILTPINHQTNNDEIMANSTTTSGNFSFAYDSNDNLPNENIIQFDEENAPINTTPHQNLPALQSSNQPHINDIPLLASDTTQTSSNRPVAFNPDYRGTLRSQQPTSSLELPSEAETTPMQYNSKFEEMRQNQLEEHQQQKQQQNQQQKQQQNQQDQQRTLSAPPRYEDIVKPTTLVEYPLELITSFGRHCLQPVPGGLHKPSFIKLSGPQNEGVVVVTDTDNIQVFKQSGQCLAMVRVEGVVCACGSGNNTLLVAFKSQVSLYRYDGSEKACLQVDVGDGNELRALTKFKKNLSFGVVAQKRSVCVVDCSFQNLVTVKTFTSASNRRSFRNVVDVAMTNKDDVVVMDAGDNHTCIYVLTTTTGQLKSAIYPKQEACGPVILPQSICLDQTNRIIITQPSPNWVLVISATNPQDPQSKSKIVVRKVSGLGEGVTVLGVDVSENGRCFMLVQKEDGCVVSAYSVV